MQNGQAITHTRGARTNMTVTRLTLVAMMMCGWNGFLPANEPATREVVKEEKGRMNESKAVEVNGLRFVARVPARIPAPRAGQTQEVDLTLQITNVSAKPLAININGVIRPQLVSETGESTGLHLGRDGTPRAKPPIKLAPGATWTWQPGARLGWTMGDRSTLQLSGPDGHGAPGFWWFGMMKQMKYRLSLEYTNNTREQAGVALWVGSATTREVQFEITPP